ncbi:hypothetical protein HH310_22555 [Actinoplanes sp. TBRC 11911]|uniref:hypothetical protein n=1 Tax=Actinoplanes sp. TBRC 11911 TaxID=2729386 RepID=UPI00145C4BC9|nr:hypothetical protein [Actinoplanes sp. TBRC 11911]NMO53950.1 hypothetical protein [Actinoplanes sp. TBRC 11911]
MTRLRRLVVLTMLAAAVSAPLGTPAEAAPAGVEGLVTLRNLTLPAGGGTLDESLSVILFADQAGWAESIILTIDTSKVGVADVVIDDSQAGGDCSAGPVVRCLLRGPHRVFKRPDDDGSYGFWTFSDVLLRLTPKKGASVGDAGILSVTTKIDDGPATTETTAIRIGEGVNLTALDEKPQRVAPGRAATLRPGVRNSGAKDVDGLTAVIGADEDLLADTNFGNCTYGYVVACTFDTTLTAGSSYRVSAPITFRVPRDAASASRTALSVEWLTAAEWQDSRADFGDLPEGRQGTGPELQLDETIMSAAGVRQADIDNDDNGSYTTVTVAGGRRTDVVAIGAAIPGTPGDHTIAVGLANRGPGTLRYPPFINNAPAVRVTLPASVAVVSADDRCTSASGDYETPPSSAPLELLDFGPAEFDCTPRSTMLAPGRELTFTFTVSGTRAVSDEGGEVQVNLFSDGVNVDRDLRNNQAEISVTGEHGKAELPITGTTAAAVASAGIVLLFAGAAIVAALRRPPRRRVR